MVESTVTLEKIQANRATLLGILIKAQQNEGRIPELNAIFDMQYWDDQRGTDHHMCVGRITAGLARSEDPDKWHLCDSSVEDWLGIDKLQLHLMLWGPPQSSLARITIEDTIWMVQHLMMTDQVVWPPHLYEPPTQTLHPELYDASLEPGVGFLA